ncbi:hypothetical protein EDC18_101303 [Natranaerovirga pectinivora]|uniref:Calcineurin-like phosphoesterase domain-containing protein n=1 Tax=Natranaerovirga pectinivora TaxID=682400 RepID=A0A4R3MP00_9FIRM|nr:metallophosphoesterase [Natranaerovirga pectinivora]TCT17007.1 hypothetical protein EDC18_101303 [Natranaerovirga pectinivora]
MAIYGIGDLHLSINSNKPMDIFGKKWIDHIHRIKKHWLECVKEDDLVLIPGDISWASTIEEAKEDLNFINDLTGKKVFIKGNHDYWWQSLQKMQEAYPAFHFIQNNSIVYKDTIGICGSRGWICPKSQGFNESDQKIYYRELNRLELSLESLSSKIKDIILLLHYPPTNESKEPSGFTELIEKYKVKDVLYGHLHSEESFNTSLQGMHNGTEYHLVSSDYLNFKLKKIRDKNHSYKQALNKPL